MPNFFIFRCSPITYPECIEKMLFGQKENMKGYVEKVKKGDILFLHQTSTNRNLTDQFIEGPFYALTDGQKNIDNDAWKSLGGFPWQVKVEKRGQVAKMVQEAFEKVGLSYSEGKLYFSFDIPHNIGIKIMDVLGYGVLNGNAKLNSDIQEIFSDIEIDYRLRYQAKFRCNDGHYVRSKSEKIIDDWLYNNNIIHAYEKKIIGENMICDFYIKSKLPEQDIYIEYWGLEDNNTRYSERKNKKQNLYKKLNLRLLNLNEQDIQNLEDRLGDQLKKLGLDFK